MIFVRKNLNQDVMYESERDMSEATQAALAPLPPHGARECKSLLTSPADHVEELLSDLQWDEIDDNYFACRSLVGEYLVFSYRKKFSATIEEFAITETAATLDEAKAACWTDYVSRMRAAFKGAAFKGAK